MLPAVHRRRASNAGYGPCCASVGLYLREREQKARCMGCGILSLRTKPRDCPPPWESALQRRPSFKDFENGSREHIAEGRSLGINSN